MNEKSNDKKTISIYIALLCVCSVSSKTNWNNRQEVDPIHISKRGENIRWKNFFSRPLNDTNILIYWTQCCFQENGMHIVYTRKNSTSFFSNIDNLSSVSS